MKRRHFIKGVGAGSAGLVTAPAWAAQGNSTASLPPYQYPKAETLEDVISEEGLVVIRLTFLDYENVKGGGLKGQVKIKRATLERSRDFFFEADESFHPTSLDLESTTMGNDSEVLVLWLRDASEESTINLGGKKGINFSLKELLAEGEISTTLSGTTLKANFLLDKEIGEVELSEFGASDPGPDFSFLVMADPQGGDPDDPEKLRTRMKIHNAYIEESVEQANKVDGKPLFCIVPGDVCDDWGEEKDLLQMNAFLSKLKMPVLYGIGNHETKMHSEFGPGYNMEAFSNFLAAQKDINGTDKLLYSFNAGNWHFIVWPDPLRQNFWETHPHYFDWLERDLKKHKDWSTIVFQHVPSQPIGITPMINYAESIYVRKTFLTAIGKHGNVKYIFSGHAHIPLKATFKTAVQVRGTKLFSLPAAGYRPRSFGEEDFYGGPSQGFTQISIKGEQVKIQYKTVTGEVFDFPEKIPFFDHLSYLLWYMEKWELRTNAQFENGDFSHGFLAWTKRFIYMEDENPSNICEVRPAPGIDGMALYLWNKRRGYQAPGQDRLPQDINRVSQALSLKMKAWPAIQLKYWIDGKNTVPHGYSGAYILVEGFRGSNNLLKLMYSSGKIWVNAWGVRKQNKEVPYHHFDMPTEVEKWHNCQLSIGSDYERVEKGKKFLDLKLDRLVVTLGVWNLNDGEEWPFGIYFTDLKVDLEQFRPSFIGARGIYEKDESQVWRRNKIWPSINIAGEHRYVIATKPYGSIQHNGGNVGDSGDSGDDGVGEGQLFKDVVPVRKQ
jgi:hypothetical protein